ncbi:MAG TPA: hypothetical protein VFL92_05215 [Sphingomonas sp.]|nr:hypothetical protein [Sphingomonas sp.]
MLRSTPLLLLPVFALALPSFAASPPPHENPRSLQKLIDCRSISDSQARLACYDQNVAALAAAEANRDIMVVDREQVKRTKRSLFGFNLPSLDLFGGAHHGKDRHEAEEEEIKQITAKIRSASRNYTGWVLTLDDGSQWEQSESALIGLRPKPGMTVTVKRAALGSYKMQWGNGVWVKARRVE